MKKKLKIGGVLDFTADFGLKVSQVTAGFGYGEGYYNANKFAMKGVREPRYGMGSALYF